VCREPITIKNFVIDTIVIIIMIIIIIITTMVIELIANDELGSWFLTG